MLTEAVAGIFIRGRNHVGLTVLLLAVAGAAPSAWAQQDASQRWNLHGQVTELPQGDAGFPAAYSGRNSLNSNGEIQETFSSDVFIGARLWRGGEWKILQFMGCSGGIRAALQRTCPSGGGAVLGLGGRGQHD